MTLDAQSLFQLCLANTIIMPLPLIGGGIKRWCCLTSVWRLSRTSGLSREQRGLGRLKLAQHRGSPRYTWLGHHFQGQKVKGQGHQVALLNAVLARQAAAGVGVGMCWPWETAATLPSARGARRFGAHGRGEVWRHIVATAPPPYSLF